jgi:hypothetical protein
MLWLVISALVFWMILQNDRAARCRNASKILEDAASKMNASKMNAEPGQQTARAVAGFSSHDYRRQKPVAGEGAPATPARCAAAAERRLAAALR